MTFTDNKKKQPRRYGREWALQFFTQLDVTKEAFSEDERELFWEQIEISSFLPKKQTKENGMKFANELITGYVNNRQIIDESLAKLTKNWKFERLGTIDRSILRLAAFELTNTEVPAPVIINEAIELAKVYGEKESPAFVNGVLDKLNQITQS